jgi:hypothetical protein
MKPTIIIFSAACVLLSTSIPVSDGFVIQCRMLISISNDRHPSLKRHRHGTMQKYSQESPEHSLIFLSKKSNAPEGIEETMSKILHTLAEMQTDITAVKTEILTFKFEVKTDIRAVKFELKTNIDMVKMEIIVAKTEITASVGDKIKQSKRGLRQKSLQSRRMSIGSRESLIKIPLGLRQSLTKFFMVNC